MTGLLAADGLKIAEERVGASLKKVNFSRRAARTINPIPYIASYCGQKLHIDQNEKFVQFGVIHVSCWWLLFDIIINLILTPIVIIIMTSFNLCYVLSMLMPDISVPMKFCLEQEGL